MSFFCAQPKNNDLVVHGEVEKPENIHISEAERKEFHIFFLKVVWNQLTSIKVVVD